MARPLRTITPEKTSKTGGNSMTSRLETYRVEAYNTAKLSENKMHDDTVANGSASAAVWSRAST